MNCISIVQVTAEGTDASVYLGVMHYVNSKRTSIMAKALDESKALFESEGVTASSPKAHLVETREASVSDEAREWAEGTLALIKEVAQQNGADPDLFIAGPIVEI